MIDAKPIFLSSGTASGLVAPPHATVVSSRAKFVTPGRFLGDLLGFGRDNAYDSDTEDGEQRRRAELHEPLPMWPSSSYD
jgi:hypothetical protein